MSLRTGLGSPSSGCRQGHGPKEPSASPRLLPLRLWGSGVFLRGGRRTAHVRSSQSGCGLTSPGTDFPACWRAQRKKHRQCTLPCVHLDLRVGGSAPHPGSEGGDSSSRSVAAQPRPVPDPQTWREAHTASVFIWTPLPPAPSPQDLPTQQGLVPSALPFSRDCSGHSLPSLQGPQVRSSKRGRGWALPVTERTTLTGL